MDIGKIKVKNKNHKYNINKEKTMSSTNKHSHQCCYTMKNHDPEFEHHQQQSVHQPDKPKQ